MSSLPVVNVYIDGYNFYGFINKPETLHLGWCNFVTLAHRLAAKAFPNGHSLGAVKYYTSMIPEGLQYREGEIERQRLWLDALKWGTDSRVTVVLGIYQKDTQKGRVEKQTDTNIAIGIVRDALTISPVDPTATGRVRDPASRFDAAILVSADKDFDPAVDMVTNEYGKDMAIFLPQGESFRRSNGRLQIYKLARNDLELSRFPDVIERPGAAPITWSKYQQLKKEGIRLYRAPYKQIDVKVDRDKLEKCRRLSERSPDPKTQVGCVIVGPERDDRRSMGWNAFAEGIAPLNSRLVAPAKYSWIEHAERNAIYYASRTGRPLQDCTMYVELLPCADCARAIIQSGIREVVVHAERVDSYEGDHYREHQLLAQEMFKEARVRVRRVSPGPSS
jgi:dCMP deaminase